MTSESAPVSGSIAVLQRGVLSEISAHCEFRHPFSKRRCERRMGIPES